MKHSDKLLAFILLVTFFLSDLAAWEKGVPSTILLAPFSHWSFTHFWQNFIAFTLLAYLRKNLISIENSIIFYLIGLYFPLLLMQLYSTDYTIYKGFSHFNYYLIGYLLVVNTHRNLIFSLFFVMCLILWISVQITSPRILHEQVTVCGIAHLYGVCSGLVYGLLKIKKGAEAPFKKTINLNQDE